MKTLSKVFFIVALGALISCGKSGKDTTASDPVDDDANQALYDQVMDIHDEVMPKMDDLYKLKKQLQDSIAKTPAMMEQAKKELEKTIQQLDSASNSMMVWMRQFNPPTDSASEEALREYLEAQLEMVKKMRENVIEALEKGARRQSRMDRKGVNDVKLDPSTYEIISTDHNANVQNFYILLRFKTFDEPSLQNFINLFRQEFCSKKCNINLYDDISIKSLITKYPLNNNEYLRVADHFVASSSFDMPEVWLYPFQDIKYKELGGKNWKK